MDIIILVASCGAPVHFDDPNLAVTFLKMATGLVDPAQWLDLIAQIAPQTIEQARRVVAACLGVPA